MLEREVRARIEVIATTVIAASSVFWRRTPSAAFVLGKVDRPHYGAHRERIPILLTSFHLFRCVRNEGCQPVTILRRAVEYVVIHAPFGKEMILRRRAFAVLARKVRSGEGITRAVMQKWRRLQGTEKTRGRSFVAVLLLQRLFDRIGVGSR